MPTTWYVGLSQETDFTGDPFTIIENPLYESSTDIQKQLETPEHFGNPHGSLTGRSENASGMGSGSPLSSRAPSPSRPEDLALALSGGRARVLPKTPTQTTQSKQIPPTSTATYEEIDLLEEIRPRAATAARYATKPLPRVPASKPDLKPLNETESPAKRNQEPISSEARMPPPTPPKPPKPGADRHFELELQTETRKTPPPTPPKPGSSVSSRSPSRDTSAPLATGGPQLGAGIAAAAAAIARQRVGQ